MIGKSQRRTQGRTRPSQSYGAYFTETFHYNNRLQLMEQTLVSAAPGFPLFNAYDISYTYSATQNNGRILQTSNTATGENVSYTYDSLSRLATANGSASSLGAAWGQSFTYDGFGNLTDKNVTAGAAPVLHVTVNAATNRFTGVNFSYDANGNLAYAGSVDTNYGFDEENRLVTQRNTTTLTSESYSYGPDNQRVWKRRADGSEEVTFYGLRGERLATFQPSYANHDVLTGATAPMLYFAGRPVSYGADRLGSKRADAPNTQGQTISHTYFPYGEEYTTTTQDTEKFGTYYRDSTTALDYARNRFYSNRLARFLTADPYRNSAGPGDPGSWNRYAYVGNDPVNFNDPAGFQACIADGESAFRFGGGCAGAGQDDPTSKRPYSDSDQRGGGPGGGSIQAWFAQQLAQGIQLALEALKDNPKCAGLFSNSWIVNNLFGRSPVTMLSDYVTANLIVENSQYPGPNGNQSFSGVGVGAVTTAGGSMTINGVRTSMPLITINAGGFYFNGGAVNGVLVQNIKGSGFQGLTSLPQVQATVILHELLHAAGVFGADIGSGGASAKNTATVVKDCF